MAKENEIQKDNEIKKEYLKGYRKIYLKIKSLEEQKQSLIESAQSAKAIKYSDMPKGSKQTDLSDYIIKLEQLYDEIEDKKQELNNLRLDIEGKITRLEDGIQSDLLRKRYIEFKKWEQICLEINYSWMHTHRIHSEALKNIMI